MPIRIWAQSASDLTIHRKFKDTIIPHARRVCDPDTEVVVHGLSPGAYPEGVTATEICCRYPLTHQLYALQIVENAIQAEREGYDAFLVTSFMDHGCELARAAVDIPIIGIGNTALLVASSIARSFGLVSHDPDQAKVLRNLIKYHSMEDKVRVLGALDPVISSEDIDAGINGSPVLLKAFRAGVAPFLKAGCDLIIPAEGFMASALANAGIHDVDGVPVFDTLGVAFGYAEMMVRLRRRTGLMASRSGDYAKAPKAALDHVRKVAIQTLTDASNLRSTAG